MTAQTYIEQLDTEAAGEALSALCVLGKTRAGREEINGLLGDRLPLHSAAQSPTPKVRKNAYRLMGALEDERDLPVLRTALQKEETLFAIPSLILALGRLGDEATLRAYEPPASPSPETDGLVAQIVLARDKALQSFETYGAEQITRLPAPRKVLCYAPEGFLEVLMEELRSLGFSAKAEHGAAAVITDRIGQVYKANCMAEALLPIAFDVPWTHRPSPNRSGLCLPSGTGSSFGATPGTGASSSPRWRARCRARTTPRPTTRSFGWTAIWTRRTSIGSCGT